MGVRSSTLARRIEAIGPRKLVNLQGGIFRWARDGRAMVDGAGQATTRVDGYSFDWEKLVPSEKRVDLTRTPPKH